MTAIPDCAGDVKDMLAQARRFLLGMGRQSGHATASCCCCFCSARQAVEKAIQEMEGVDDGKTVAQRHLAI